MIRYMFIFMLFTFISCQDGKRKVFNYKETVEIYVYSAYIGDMDPELVREKLDSKYTIQDDENQNIYSTKSLASMASSRAKWNKFIKDTVDYYISLKKKLNVEYYHFKGYNRETKRFNDNFILDKNKPLPKAYWKLHKYKRKGAALILIRELFVNGKLRQQTYYEMHQQKIKDIVYVPKVKIRYFQDNVELKMAK